MRSLSLAMIAGLFLMACGSQKQQAVVVEDQGIRFSIYAVHEYCGGAPPSDEIMEKLQTPKPLTDTLYIHPSKDIKREKLLHTIVLNDEGWASIPSIDTGNYVVFNQAKIDMVENPEMDEMTRCRIMNNSMPFFSFSIAEDTKLVTDTVPVICDPCIPPMP